MPSRRRGAACVDGHGIGRVEWPEVGEMPAGQRPAAERSAARGSSGRPDMSLRAGGEGPASAGARARGSTGPRASRPAPSADLLPPGLLGGLGGLEIVARHVVRGFVAGLHRSPFHGAGEEFTRHRAYQQGDEVRLLDWRLFARTDRLYVKEFRHDSNLQCFVLLDTSASMAYGDRPSKLRYATYVAAGVAHMMLAAGDAVGLAATGNAEGDRARLLMAPRNRQGQLHDLLLALERLRPEGRGSLADALGSVGHALRRQGRVVIVSDLLEPDDGSALLDSVGRLRARGDEVIAFRVATREELGDRPLPAARFFDPERPSRAVAAVPAADPGFRDRVAAYYDRLVRGFRERGAELELLATADPLARALRAWVASR